MDTSLSKVSVVVLEAVALALNVTVVPTTDDTVVAALDARRGELYWALYRPDPVARTMVRVTEPVVSSPEDMIVHVNDRSEPVWCVGSGFVRYRNDAEALQYAQFAPDHLAMPDAQWLLDVAIQKLARDETVSARDIEPMYLRAPDAEINWAVREGQ